MQHSLVMFSIMQNMLHLLHIPITKMRLQQFISEQMYHGSIRTITEVLNDLNIESKVYQLEEEDVYLIECPVIARFRDNENRFVVVGEFSDKLQGFN